MALSRHDFNLGLLYFSLSSAMLMPFTVGTLLLCGISLQIAGVDSVSTLCILQCDLSFGAKTQVSGCNCDSIKSKLIYIWVYQKCFLKCWGRFYKKFYYKWCNLHVVLSSHINVFWGLDIHQKSLCYLMNQKWTTFNECSITVTIFH